MFSGTVVTQECVEKLIKQDMIDPVSGGTLSDKDIIPLQRVCVYVNVEVRKFPYKFLVFIFWIFQTLLIPRVLQLKPSHIDLTWLAHVQQYKCRFTTPFIQMIKNNNILK